MLPLTALTTAWVRTWLGACSKVASNLRLQGSTLMCRPSCKFGQEADQKLYSIQTVEYCTFSVQKNVASGNLWNCYLPHQASKSHNLVPECCMLTDFQIFIGTNKDQTPQIHKIFPYQYKYKKNVFL